MKVSQDAHREQESTAESMAHGYLICERIPYIKITRYEVRLKSAGTAPLSRMFLPKSSMTLRRHPSGGIESNAAIALAARTDLSTVGKGLELALMAFGGNIAPPSIQENFGLHSKAARLTRHSRAGLCQWRYRRGLPTGCSGGERVIHSSYEPEKLLNLPNDRHRFAPDFSDP
jgi:hypothetical protein